MKLPDVVPDLSVVMDTDTAAVINAQYGEMSSGFEYLRSCNGLDRKENHRPTFDKRILFFQIKDFTVRSMAAYTAAILHAQLRACTT